MAVLGLIVVAVVVLLLIPRGGGTGRPKGQTTPTLKFVAKLNTVGQGKAPDAGARQRNGDAITQMFNDFYQTAFVDPAKWGDGTFPSLRDLFAKEVQPSFTKDVASLTIGEARSELRFVDPAAANLVVTVYYDRSARPTLAVAAATFSGRGTLKATGPKLVIQQKATFYLQRQGDRWTITAYDADQKQDTATPTPSPSGTR